MKKWVKVKVVFDSKASDIEVRNDCSRSGVHPKLYIIAAMAWLSGLIRDIDKSGDMSKAECCDAAIRFLEDIKKESL